MDAAGDGGQRADDGGQNAETTRAEQKVLARIQVSQIWERFNINTILPSTHLQLMSDRVTVSVQEEDQRRHLVDGAGVSGRAAHTQTVLHLHTPESGYSRPCCPPPLLSGSPRHSPGRSAWTSPSVRSDRRAWSRPD